MPDAKVVSPDQLSKAVAEFLDEQCEYNVNSLKENLLAAAKASKHNLSSRTGKWVRRNLVWHDRGYHRKGWKIYRENWYKARGAWDMAGTHSAVVASMIEPQLTHLLEFGHNIIIPWLDEPYQGRTTAYYYIKGAYLVGRQKLLEAKVDNP